MAEIFLAKQAGPEGFEKTVVVKRVLPHLSCQADFVRMFLDEARLAARLSHPNLVHVFDFGEANGAYYLAMEYLAGEDLGAVLAQAQRKGRPIPVHVAALIAGLACDGLHYVHTLTDSEGSPMHVVHRDISPSNLFLTFQGNLTILDFGVATAQGRLAQTRGGVLKGKLAYVSPEQVHLKPVDGRADVFSLGIVLHEMLTGRRLFARKGEAATLRALLEDPIPPPSSERPEVPPELDEIVAHALARDPGARFPSALAMREAIDAYLATRAYVRSTLQLQGLLLDLFGPERLQEKLADVSQDEVSQLTEGIDLGATRNDGPQSPLPVASPADERTETDGPAENQTRMLPGKVEQTLELPGRARTPRKPPLRWRWAAGAAAATLVVGGLVALRAPRPAISSPTATAPSSAIPAPAPTPAVPPAPMPPSAPPPTVTPIPAPARVPPHPQSAPRPTTVATRALPPHRPPSPRPAPGTLTVNCLPWCHVYLDGNDTGLDSPARAIRVPPGRHKLRVVNPSLGRERSVDIDVRSGQETFKALEL